MKRSNWIYGIVLVSTAVVLAGCGSSSNSPATQQVDDVQVGVDFRKFVSDQFAATANNTASVQLNSVDFNDADQQNPQAFDVLLAP